MKNTLTIISISSILTLSAVPVMANEMLIACLQKNVLSASSETTIAELRDQCQTLTIIVNDEVDTSIEEEKIAEDVISTNAFSLLQHKTNYVLPLSYNDKADNIEPSSIPGNARSLDPTEFKFQLSVKTRLWSGVFGTRANFYAAYTNTSWWQAYNKDESSPFRETNHQPELFFDIPLAFRFAGWELANLTLGAEHSSNGRSGEFSRTWNRVYSQLSFSNKYNQIHIKPWVSVSDIEDNPDIEEFRGRVQISGEHIIGEHDFNWRLQNTLDSNNRTSIETDWSFPINGRNDMKFFIQYFEGYGESLIDYDLKARRIGVGFKLGI